MNDIWIVLNHKKVKACEIKTNNNIRERYRHGMVYFMEHIYVFCGEYFGEYLHDVCCLKRFNNEYYWETIYIKDVPRISGFSCNIYKNNILIFGGTSPCGYINKLYSMNIVNKTFKEIKIERNNIDMIEIKTRFNHSSCIVDDKLFIFGGRNLKDNNIYFIDLSSETYTLHFINMGQSIPSLFEHKMISNMQNNNYWQTFVNGYVRQYFKDHIPIEILNIIHLFCDKNECMFIIGGVIHDSLKLNNKYKYSKELVSLNMKNMNCQLITKKDVLKDGLSGFSGCIISNNIILFGGRKSENDISNDILYLSLKHLTK